MYITACTRELAKSSLAAVVPRDVQRDLEHYAQTNALLKGRVEFLEAELARRPQYVTNFVTNFVAVPPGEQRSTTRLTQQTQPIATTSSQQPVEPPPGPIVRSEPRTSPKGGAMAKTSPSNPRHQTNPPPKHGSDTPSTSSTAVRAVHTVRPGETLASLATQFGVSLQALKAANPGAAGGVRAGQKINIPK